MNSTKKGAMSINDYVLKMKCLSESLAAAGQPLVAGDVISSVLGGLGPEYDPVVVTITAKQAFIRGRGYPNNNRGRFRGRGHGRYGGRGGPKLFCQLCGKSGHAVATCYYRFDQNFQGINQQQQQHSQQ
ncbi:hypothetical protein ACOSQ3_020608 [Xanthoceras sorbifolium]